MDLSYKGQATIDFENMLKDWLGAKYVIATNTGTAALHLSLLALGINSGSVITQALTFIATANVIKYQSCYPVFFDVDDSQCINHKIINKKLSTKKWYLRNLRAIIPVHLNRNIGDQKELVKIGKQYNIPIIEDACQALGIWKLKGDCGAVSFNGNKIITTGGGGAWCTDNKDLYEKAYQIVNIGRTKGLDFHEVIGVNYRMPSLNALRGIQELEKLPVYLKTKKPIERAMQTPLTQFTPYREYFHNDLKKTYEIWQTKKGVEFYNG